MNILHKASKTVRILTAPRQTFYTVLEQLRMIIIAETLLRRGEISYFIILPIIIGIVLVTDIIDKCSHKQICARQLKVVYDFLSPKTRIMINDLSICNDKFGIFCTWCIYPALYFKKTYVVYTILTLGSIGSLVHAIWDDIIIWHFTIGNTINFKTAVRLRRIIGGKRISMKYRRKPYGDVDLLMDTRYYLCDSLRCMNWAKLDLIRDLVETFPGYMSIVDRDGVTSPFQLACQFCRLDIVQCMVELDNNLMDLRDGRGNSPLHWACRNTTSGKHEVVNYLLEKRMSLVAETNMDGDLPIHVASDKVNDCHSTQKEYIDIVWCLLLAYPESLNRRIPAFGPIKCSESTTIDGLLDEDQSTFDSDDDSSSKITKSLYCNNYVIKKRSPSKKRKQSTDTETDNIDDKKNR